MAEEHGCQSTEGHQLCANNCGFFGSSTTQNLCSKCYRDLFVKDENSKPDNFFTLPPPSPSIKKTEDSTLISSQDEAEDDVEDDSIQLKESVSVVAQPNRCTVCRKKLGLTGFKCRCGTTFCGTHRYPEQHSCTFDFKAMGRQAIAKENPLIKAHKLEKI